MQGQSSFSKIENHNANHWEFETHSYNCLHYRLILLLREVIRLAPNRLLEVGCGVGVFREELLKIVGPVIDYYGIDISESAVQRINNSHVVTADLNYEFPFYSESFNAIVGSGIMEYIEELEAFLREANKRLKKDGSLLVSYFNMTHFWRRLQSLLGKKPYRHPEWRNALSYPQLREAYTRTGFRINKEMSVSYGLLASPSIWNTSHPSALGKLLLSFMPDLFVHTKIFVLKKSCLCS